MELHPKLLIVWRFK